jgi:SRSO17 transposase
MSLVNLIVSDVKQVVKRFHEFHERYSSYFATKTRNMAEQGKQYIHGQLLCQNRGNMKEFQKIVPDSNDQSLNHFVSNSPWEDEPIVDSIEKTVSVCIGDPEHGSIHVDESGLPKQGKDSVGASPQYCGRLGKVANCQMGVFLGYTHNNYRILMDKRLYLPQKWIDDHERREKCGVPEDVT